MEIWWQKISIISSNPVAFFEFFGLFGLGLILFLETGLFCFFLPGDSLLFTLGLISSKGAVGETPIVLETLIPTLFLATVLGDHLSYFIGLKFSSFITKNAKKFWIEEDHIHSAKKFYDSHGGKTILFCKFIAFIRTFAPFVAGTTQMSYLRFFVFDVIGAMLWVGGIVLLGHYLGEFIHIRMESYFNYFVIFLGILILSPFFIKLFKGSKHAKN